MKSVMVFDSGIGGLSILKEMVSQSLSVPITYLADQAYFPYGTKSPEWLQQRLHVIAKWAKKHDPIAFVVACNTATVSAVNEMRHIVACPVIGVEPVVKPLASYHRPLILATHVTATSQRTQELIRLYGPHIRVEHAEELADAIEDGDQDKIMTLLTTVADHVKELQVDAIGLSCTHYPLVADMFRRLVPATHIYDPSAAVVYQLKKSLPSRTDTQRHIEFLTTGSVVRFKEQVARYLEGTYPVQEWTL